MDINSIICATAQNKNMSQDFFSTSSTVVNNSVKEEIFSIPSSDISVKSVGINTINEATPTIESNPAVQGGDWCLKGTRITVQGILEAISAGRTIDEMVATLKKYFRWNITKEELEKAITEYNNEMIADNFSV